MPKDPRDQAQARGEGAGPSRFPRPVSWLQSQSQTIEGDSDVEDTTPSPPPRMVLAQETITPQPRGQQRTPPTTAIKAGSRKERRETLLEGVEEDNPEDPTNPETYIRLVDNGVEPSISLLVHNLEEFVHSATEKPAEWWTAIARAVEDLTEANRVCVETAHEIRVKDRDIALLKEQVQGVETKFQDNQSRLIIAETKAAKASRTDQNETIARLRVRRTHYRDQAKMLAQEVATLKLDKETLEKEIQGFTRKENANLNSNQDSDMDDSDVEDIRPSRSAHRREGRTRFTSLSPERQRGHEFTRRRDVTPPLRSRLGDLLSQRTDRALPQFGAEFPQQPAQRPKEYTKLESFDGKAEDWERWRGHLRAKLLHDAWMYPTELSKIWYAREHTRSLAYDTIKHRAGDESANPYKEVEELINDLEVAFGAKNKEGKMMDKLLSVTFRMGSEKKSETFEEFLLRFNNLAIPLNLSDILKMKYLRNKVNSKMRYRMTHLKNCNNLKDFVDGCRGVYDELEDLKDYGHTNPSAAPPLASRKRHNRERSRSWSPDRKKAAKKPSNSYPLNRFPPHIQARLKKERRCYKCLKKGHVPTDEDAPCKHEKASSPQDAQVELAKMGIEWDGVDVEGYESESSRSEEDAHSHTGSEN